MIFYFLDIFFFGDSFESLGTILLEAVRAGLGVCGSFLPSVNSKIFSICRFFLAIVFKKPNLCVLDSI